MPTESIVTGVFELGKFLNKLPQSAAVQLQKVVIANHRDHQKEVVRSSDFKNFTDPQVRQLVRFQPRKLTGGGPKRLEDVEGETASFWVGTHDTPKTGAAGRIEKKVGKAVNRPRKSRHLLIPRGDFLTPTGRPRRERRGKFMVPIDLSKLEGATVVKIRGELLLIQHLRAGQRGRFEKPKGTGRTKSGRKKTISKKRLGSRTRIIGELKRSAKQAQPLDFFGSWDRLEPAREARYQRMLDRIAEGKK